MEELAIPLILFGLKYGPEAVAEIGVLLKKNTATVDDVLAAFANLKPYSAYGIPDIAPTKPA